MKNFEIMTNPELDYYKMLELYRKYCNKERDQKREPVSFQRFVTGRY